MYIHCPGGDDALATEFSWVLASCAPVCKWIAASRNAGRQARAGGLRASLHAHQSSRGNDPSWPFSWPDLASLRIVGIVVVRLGQHAMLVHPQQVPLLLHRLLLLVRHRVLHLRPRQPRLRLALSPRPSIRNADHRAVSFMHERARANAGSPRRSGRDEGARRTSCAAARATATARAALGLRRAK